MMVRPVFKDGDARNDLPLGGGPGRYRVVFTLARPGYVPKPENEVDFSPDIPGDSHLAIAAPAFTPPGLPSATAIKVYTTTDVGQLVFVGHANAKGFLGRLETELEAPNLAEAERRAYRLLAPSLSNWSAHLDIPLYVWRILVTEVASGCAQVTMVNPFDEMPFALGGNASMSAHYRAFVSLYREALESNSRVYQFLCLFKIAEGLRNRRTQLAATAKAKGDVVPSRPSERIPKAPVEFAPWLDAIYPGRRSWDPTALDSVFVAEALGRKINDLLDKELVDLRNDVAHALSDSTGSLTLVVDEALHLARIDRWLPLMKCIVRRMLKDDFPSEFLSYLREDRTIAQ